MIGRVVLFAIGSLLTATAPANAVELTVSSYRETSGADRLRAQDWLNGVYSGLAMANVGLRLDGREQLYCAPGMVVFNTVQIEDILYRYAAKPEHAMKPESSIRLVLLFAMKEAFPCPRMDNRVVR